eukprot:364942-Chlamydomonas_euryale.AAC.13
MRWSSVGRLRGGVGLSRGLGMRASAGPAWPQGKERHPLPCLGAGRSPDRRRLPRRSTRRTVTRRLPDTASTDLGAGFGMNARGGGA